MVWVWVFVGIAVLGLVVAISYAVWLAHKASDVWAEAQMLGRRGQEFADLLDQLSVDQTEEQRAEARRALGLPAPRGEVAARRAQPSS